MFVSLSGLLLRLQGRSDQMFTVEEFLKHYAQAKEAHKSGDKETVEQFFNLYVTHHEAKGGVSEI